MSGSYQRPPLRVALMGLGRAMTDEHLPVFTAHPSLFHRLRQHLHRRRSVRLR